jgi:hypothetical protein
VKPEETASKNTGHQKEGESPLKKALNLKTKGETKIPLSEERGKTKTEGKNKDNKLKYETTKKEHCDPRKKGCSNNMRTICSKCQMTI